MLYLIPNFKLKVMSNNVNVNELLPEVLRTNNFVGVK